MRQYFTPEVPFAPFFSSSNPFLLFIARYVCIPFEKLSPLRTPKQHVRSLIRFHLQSRPVFFSLCVQKKPLRFFPLAKNDVPASNVSLSVHFLFFLLLSENEKTRLRATITKNLVPSFFRNIALFYDLAAPYAKQRSSTKKRIPPQQKNDEKKSVTADNPQYRKTLRRKRKNCRKRNACSRKINLI